MLADTAGLRAGADAIEAEGVRRALARAEAADLRLLRAATPRGRKVLAASAALRDGAALLVSNKVDQAAPPAEGLAAFGRDGAGAGRAGRRVGRARGGPAGRRCADRDPRAPSRGAGECVGCLSRAIAGIDPELVAEDLRLAVRALGRITGRVDVEDLLDVIFREFCIGK